MLLLLDARQEPCSSNEQGGRVHPAKRGQPTDEEAGYAHRRIGLWPQDGQMRTDGTAATRLTIDGGALSQDRRMQPLPLDGRIVLQP